MRDGRTRGTVPRGRWDALSLYRSHNNSFHTAVSCYLVEQFEAVRLVVHAELLEFAYGSHEQCSAQYTSADGLGITQSFAYLHRRRLARPKL